MFEAWRELAQSPKRSSTWFNMTDDELSKWGFECMGAAPSIEGKMTMYKADISHAAIVSPSVDFRWSHTFAFSDDFAPAMRMGDIIPQ